MGARPEWVFALLGAWRLGAVALPCSEQLRAKDIALRIEQARPALVLAAARDMDELQAALAGVERSAALARRRRRRAATRRARGRAGRHDRRRSGARDLHLRDRGRAPRRRAHAGLSARPADTGQALVRPPCGRARLVHGGERMVQVRPQRVRGAVDQRARRPCFTTPASSPPSGLPWPRSRESPCCANRPTEYRMIAKRASLPADASPVPAPPRLGRRAAQPGGDRGLPRGPRARHPRRLRPDGDRSADRHAGRRAPCGPGRWASRCPASGSRWSTRRAARHPRAS